MALSTQQGITKGLSEKGAPIPELQNTAAIRQGFLTPAKNAGYFKKYIDMPQK